MSKYVKLDDVLNMLDKNEAQMIICQEGFKQQIKERGIGRLSLTTFEGAAFGIHHVKHRLELDLKSIELPDNLIQ